MTITEFLTGNTIPADAITAWTDRKGNAPDHVTARCGFLRKHLAKFVKDNPIPEDTAITVARRKIATFGIGELLVAGDKTFAAVAGAFRVGIVLAEAAAPVKEEKEEASAAEVPATETPVAEAAAPAKPKAKRARKAKAPKAVPAEEIAPAQVKAAIAKVYEDAKDIPFMPDPEDVSDLDA